MEISYDKNKSDRNVRERGLSFDQASNFDFDNAVISVDDRREYGERRYVALGYLDRRLHVLCFTSTRAGIRVISFRKANQREATRNGKALTLD